MTEWFFTSSATGEVQKKLDASVTPLSIKKHFVAVSDPRDLSRHLARLVLQDGGDGGRIALALLTDVEFNLVLCQPSSRLWCESFLMQPLLASEPSGSKQPPPAQLRGTFVAKYNALASSVCVRVIHLEAGGLYELAPTGSSGTSTISGTNQRIRSRGTNEMTRGIEQIIKSELRKLVRELEAAYQDTLRLLTAEFQVAAAHRLVLVRVSGVVLASDTRRKLHGAQRSVGPQSARPQVLTVMQCG